MNDLRIVLSDLDGTLLTDSKELPKDSVRTFNDLAELDIKTALVTARPYRLAKNYADELSADAIICNSGAEIYRCGQLMCSHTVSGDFVRYFASGLEKALPDIYIGAEVDGQMYANYNMIANWDKIDAERCDFRRFPFEHASKLIVNATSSDELATIASFVGYQFGEVHLELAHTTAIITSAKASKAISSARLAYSYDIGMFQAAAFGDDISDVELLRAVKYPFCVTNGHSMAKCNAKIIGSNEDGAVIKAIRKYILGDVYK